MSKQHWILLDAKHGVTQDSFNFSEKVWQPDGSGDAHVKIIKHRLSGGLGNGIDIVKIDNGVLSMTVLPTKGMNIWRAKCGDVELKWDSPVPGPVNPALIPIFDPGGTGFLEGFDEWLVRCGLESNGSPEFDANGALRYPLHGRIGNLPAQFLELSINRETGEISLTAKVIEAKLFFKNLELQTTITTFAGSSQFTVKDTITNLSAHPGEFELLYHINTGQPFASPGGRVAVPFERMAPRTDVAAQNLPDWNKLGPETPGSDEVVFFFEPGADSVGNCKTLLVNAAGDRGLVLGFNRNSFPYFSLWKSRLANADGYVVGMEPAVNFPNTKSFEKEHGRVVPLQPGESRSFELHFEVLHDTESVNRTEQEIRTIPAAGVIESAPRKEWTP
ncbi:DUF4432 domain-containing protein [Planctomycetales bacterium]|nr:DUF4432 domain-containing protein [Planctomycetales bacterium]